MPPQRKSGGWIEEQLREVDQIFDSRCFQESTLRGKRTHLKMFLLFIYSLYHEAARSDSTLPGFDFVQWVESSKPRHILYCLKEWGITMSLSGSRHQTISSYIESAYSYCINLNESLSWQCQLWHHLWSQIKRVSNRNACRHAPIVSRDRFDLLTPIGRMIALLLLTGSLRFHCLKMPVIILQQCPRYIEVEFPHLKYIPSVSGFIKRLYCNCYRKHGSKFCFVHTFRKAVSNGMIQGLSHLLSRRNLAFAEYDFARVGIRPHSPHRTVCMWLRLAMLHHNLKIDVPLINFINNWNTHSLGLMNRYAEHFESFRINLLPPYHNIVARTKADWNSVPVKSARKRLLERSGADSPLSKRSRQNFQ